jgi:hypothetical protein
MRRKFMDKKILLGGAAALIMGAGFFAAPASAAIEISHSGEATLSALMTDACNVTQADIDDSSFRTLADNTVATIPGDCAAGANEESPIWATSSKLDWSAGGTLANGLSVSTSQDADINLSGAFGSFTFKKDGDSAVKASMANSDGDIDVEGENNLGGHSLATSGTAGDVTVLYQAPSMGGMDIFVSYAPNSDADATLDNSKYTDTIGFGASFAVDAMTISAGYEAATANLAGACGADGDGAGAQLTTSALADQADEAFGGAYCGD